VGDKPESRREVAVTISEATAPSSFCTSYDSMGEPNEAGADQTTRSAELVLDPSETEVT
jgi:hypothetical protein